MGSSPSKVVQEEADTIALFDLLRELDLPPLSAAEIHQMLSVLSAVERGKEPIRRYKCWMLGDALPEDEARKLSLKVWKVAQWLLAKVPPKKRGVGR